MKVKPIIGAVIILGLAACSSLPNVGPTVSQVHDQATGDGQPRFNLVKIDAQAIAASAARPKKSLSNAFDTYGKPPGQRLAVGDTVVVTIWQTAASGLLGGNAAGGLPSGGASEAGAGLQNFVIPEQMVGDDGAITVPYAGRVPVAGQTTHEVEQTIERRLAQRIVEPQILVTIPKNISGTATVAGEAVSGARVPLSAMGDRLLQVIATAGGAKSAPYETAIRVARNGISVTVPMEAVISDPRENIYVWPGDEITLVKAPQTFSVFGATLNNTQLPFNADTVSLAQAIAKAGGLQDLRADPSGVFLFRFEPPEVVAALGSPAVTPADTAGGATQSAPSGADLTPVLYQLDLHEIGGYFLASRFPVRDEDIIYVAGASSNDLQKFFTLLSSITGPVISGTLLTRGN